MAERLSQKAVSEDFYERCIAEGVPCFVKHGKNQGHFRVYPSYGGLQLQYVYSCGGVTGITSGFVGAREMYNSLLLFDPVAMYKSFRKREIDLCKSKKERMKRERSLKRT